MNCGFTRLNEIRRSVRVIAARVVEWAAALCAGAGRYTPRIARASQLYFFVLRLRLERF